LAAINNISTQTTLAQSLLAILQYSRQFPEVCRVGFKFKSVLGRGPNQLVPALEQLQTFSQHPLEQVQLLMQE
jgi:hypothetical protein